MAYFPRHALQRRGTDRPAKRGHIPVCPWWRRDWDAVCRFVATAGRGGGEVSRPGDAAWGSILGPGAGDDHQPVGGAAAASPPPPAAGVVPRDLRAAMVAAAVVVVQFTGTSSRTARVPASGSAHQRQLPRSGSARSSGRVGTVRSQAAAWVAGQVSSDETIACDPLMCAALGAHGVASSRLLSLQASASGAPGADVIVASPSAQPAQRGRAGAAGQLRVRRQPGRGPHRSPGGAAAYQARSVPT